MRSEIKRCIRKSAPPPLCDHDQVEAMDDGERVVVMNTARIEQIGTEELYHKTATRSRRGSSASPAMTFIPAARGRVRSWYIRLTKRILFLPPGTRRQISVVASRKNAARLTGEDIRASVILNPA